MQKRNAVIKNYIMSAQKRLLSCPFDEKAIENSLYPLPSTRNMEVYYFPLLTQQRYR